MDSGNTHQDRDTDRYTQLYIVRQSVCQSVIHLVHHAVHYPGRLVSQSAKVKVKNDHRSRFSNLWNWKEEA